MLFSHCGLFLHTLDIFGKEVFICWVEQKKNYDWKVQVFDHFEIANDNRENKYTSRRTNSTTVDELTSIGAMKQELNLYILVI